MMEKMQMKPFCPAVHWGGVRWSRRLGRRANRVLKQRASSMSSLAATPDRWSCTENHLLAIWEENLEEMPKRDG